jgi:chromate transporter
VNAETNVVWALFLHLAVLSLMAVGGGVIALTPDIVRVVVDENHWMTADAFVECFTIAQIAPGPNMLFATLIGMRVGGLFGAVTATVALVVPPALLVVAALHVGGRVKTGRWGAICRSALVPISVGMMAAACWGLIETSTRSVAQAVLLVGFVVVLVRTRINPLILIVCGGVLGALGIV